MDKVLYFVSYLWSRKFLLFELRYPYCYQFEILVFHLI